MSDEALVQHIRAKLGHLIRSPGLVDVSVNSGFVTLQGPVAGDEMEMLASYVSSMRGVKGLNNGLRPENVGGEKRPASRGTLERMAQGPWGPGARTASGVTGGALAVYGATRRDGAGICIGLLGLGLLAQRQQCIDVAVGWAGKTDGVEGWPAGTRHGFAGG